MKWDLYVSALPKYLNWTLQDLGNADFCHPSHVVMFATHGCPSLNDGNIPGNDVGSVATLKVLVIWRWPQGHVMPQYTL